tara:strand:- start:1140 stop:1967 length:828 start_codon:yes stop_codon:yes gene_type:complete
MTSLSQLKERFHKTIAKKMCSVKDMPNCPNDKCSCAISAEIKAYWWFVIPKGYPQLSIFDFDGKTRAGKTILDPIKALDAKKKLIQYCWNGIPVDKLSERNDKTEALLRHFSVINKRRERGSSMVIYGSEEGSNPSGKTFAASIVMKEAIAQRRKPEFCNQTYFWVDYQTLKKSLQDGDTASVDYETCDWLVVDDIIADVGKIGSQKVQYLSSLFDPFFVYRYNNRLPTILVFRMDVVKFDPSDIFGRGIGRICEDQDTTMVELSGGEGNKIAGQ